MTALAFKYLTEAVESFGDGRVSDILFCESLESWQVFCLCRFEWDTRMGQSSSSPATALEFLWPHQFGVESSRDFM